MPYSITIDEDNLDPNALRNVFGQFLTGVTIITTVDADGNNRGFTANSFASVSLDPPMILVCLGKQAHSLDAFVNSNGFGVNILSAEQESISSLFASKQANKFDHAKHTTKITGAPIIGDSLAWIDCVVANNIDAGDHIILVGRVKALGSNTGRPLGFWRGSYVRFGLEEDNAELMDPGTHKVIASCVLQWNRSVLLQKAHPDRDLWGLIEVPLQKNAGGHRQQMAEYLKKRNINANVEFLYAVFDTSSNDESRITYRGHFDNIDNIENDNFKFFSLDNMEWEKIHLPEIRDLLQRYREESAVDNYGVYADTASGGGVYKPIS